MPYTLSHTIISLPLFVVARRNIPLVALIIGCMSPDFPYLLALTPVEAPGHSLRGALIYCIVPSLFVLLVWYRWLEIPTLDFLKLPQRTKSFTMLDYLLMFVGVLLGTYSHVLWDATSHLNGAFVANSIFWQKEILSLPLYKWNQYGSGVIGMVSLISWYFYALSKNKQNFYRGRLLIGLIVYFISIATFIILANVIHGSTTYLEYAVRSALGIITGGIIGACIYASIVNLGFQKNMPKKSLHGRYMR